jgi:hypothetical protein
MFPIRSLPHLRHCIRQFHASRLIKSVVTENVPALGESITEGTISKWMKNIADKIAVDDVVVVVETDKVTVDIKATVSGVLSEQLVSASENVIRVHTFNTNTICFIFKIGCRGYATFQN